MAELTSPPRLIVVNRRPGLIRGGRGLPALSSFALDEFSREQLQQIFDEPEMSVLLGHVVAPEQIDDVLTLAKKPKAKAAS